MIMLIFSALGASLLFAQLEESISRTMIGKTRYELSQQRIVRLEPNLAWTNSEYSTQFIKWEDIVTVGEMKNFYMKMCLINAPAYPDLVGMLISDNFEGEFSPIRSCNWKDIMAVDKPIFARSHIDPIHFAIGGPYLGKRTVSLELYVQEVTSDQYEIYKTIPMEDKVTILLIVCSTVVGLWCVSFSELL